MEMGLTEALREAAVLCYCEGSFAYFTTQALERQTGDDWDDAPWHCNAGEPYLPSVFYYADGRVEPNPRDHNADGSPKWHIIKVAHDGPFELPDDYSVDQINAGAAPWLSAHWSNPPVYISAGTSLTAFRRMVAQAGGEVYEAAYE